MTSWSDSGKLRLHFIEHRTNDGTNAGERLFFGLKKFVAGSLHSKDFGFKLFLIQISRVFRIALFFQLH